MKPNSLEKSLQVIDLLSKNPQGLSLSELTEVLAFPKSTIHRILSTFFSYDYVSQNPENKKYSLGFRFLTISKAILDNIDVRKTASNYLRKLHQECNEAVHLYILRNGKVSCIDKVEKPGRLSLATYIGFTTDPHAAAGGKVLLSELSNREVMDIYKERPLKAYGKNTITSMAQLLEELENIKKQGYTIDNEEYYDGVRCVSAPIRAGGKIIAALSVTGSIFTITMERINRELIRLVTRTGEEISSEMEW
jgi:DNA-binding IclR family transcriptional regulator